jgi:hypothetical protein
MVHSLHGDALFKRVHAELTLTPDIAVCGQVTAAKEADGPHAAASGVGGLAANTSTVCNRPNANSLPAFQAIKKNALDTY